MNEQAEFIQNTEINNQFFTYIDLVDLPNSMQELSQLIGLTAVVLIVDLSGGTKLSVPGECRNDHYLYKLIGKESFTKLVSYNGGEMIEVPICATAWRRAKVAYYHHKGYSKYKIAHKLNVTKRCILKIANILKHQRRI